MSTWIELKDEDIEIDINKKEFNLYLGHDYSGNNYATITFEQVKEMIKEVNYENKKN